jgi:hypothetical protein
MAARTTQHDATFDIEIEEIGGHLFGDYTWVIRINKSTNIIASPGGPGASMNLDYFDGIISCFNGGSYPGYLQIIQDRKIPSIARIAFWFDAPGEVGKKDVTYILIMEGTFNTQDDIDNWPPDVGTSSDLTFGTWSFGVNGNIKKYGDIPCNLTDYDGTFNVTVKVTRTE